MTPPRLAGWLLDRCLDRDTAEAVTGDLSEEFGRRAASRPFGARLWFWRQTLASIAAAGVTNSRPRTEAAGLTRSRPGLLDGLGLDVRHVLRLLSRSPGFTSVAVLSLAMGIGANTAIFSVIRSVLLDPMPVERPDELALVYWARPANNNLRFLQLNSSGYQDTQAKRGYNSNYTYPQFRSLQAAAGDAAEIAGFNFVSRVTVSVGDQPATAATGFLVSGNYFSALRLGTILGRPLDAHDDSVEARVAVISHAFWLRAFGGDAAVVGRRVRINGEPFDVVGVTPAGFRGLSSGRSYPPTDVTLPLSTQPIVSPKWTPATANDVFSGETAATAPNAGPARTAGGRSLFTATDRYWIRLLARVRPEAARERLHATLTAALAQQFGAVQTLTAEELRQMDVRLLPAPRGLDSLRADVRQPLFILGGVMAAVLLIACVNLASLMLARGVARQRELAVRRALGASRARIVRGLLLEGAVLAAAGGVAGLGLAFLSAPLITSMLTTGLGTLAARVSIDWTLVAATAGISCVAAVLSALLPALRLTGRGASRHLRHQTIGAGAPRLTIGRMLIALQIAISVPLVVGAGLFLRTIHNLSAVDLGFDASGLMLFDVDATQGRTDPQASARVYGELLERLSAVPGVTSVTLVENALVSGWKSSGKVTIDGTETFMRMNAVGPRFFETMGIPMVAGRSVGPQDVAAAPRVVVINQTAARAYWPGTSPLGRHFMVGSRDVEVIGVVADSKYEDLKSGMAPTFYDPYTQRAGLRDVHVVLRTAVAPAGLAAAVRQAVADVDRNLPITDVKTQDEQIGETMGQERVITRLLVIFGGFALLLACIGLHGVTSYSVARRTNEIGIRMALGAGRSQVLWLILRQVFILAVAGVAVGLPVAYLAGPLVRALLFGLDPHDAATMAVAAALMVGVALGAGLLPARRAARMEALSALRTD
jgi:predicted permease